MLSPERLKEIEVRETKATPGPWTHPSQRQPWSDAATSPLELRAADGSRVLSRNWKEICANFEFISHARQDTDALLLDRRELVELVRKSCDLVDDLRSIVNDYADAFLDSNEDLGKGVDSLGPADRQTYDDMARLVSESEALLSNPDLVALLKEE